MKQFIKAFLTFLHMYRHGFFPSQNTHVDRDGTVWGFYRFNEQNQAALFDIDFSFDKNHVGYYHVHGDDFRLSYTKDNKTVKQYSLFKK